jgi:hypothetical protein
VLTVYAKGLSVEVIDVPVDEPPPPSEDAEADWVARSTGGGVVFAHDFRSESEIESFVQIASRDDRDAARTVWNPTGIPGTGGGALNSRCYGTTLAAPVSVTADGATDTWQVADASKLPDVESFGDCLLLVGKGSANGEMVSLLSRDLAANTITVVRGVQSTPKAYPAGQRVGSDPSDNWQRPLCAIAAPNNGKAVDDIGITQGHSVARPWQWSTNAHARNAFGWWGAEKANWPAWTDAYNRTWTDPFEGTEFYLQFRAKWSKERFTDDLSGKWFYLDATQSGMQQIFSNFQGTGAPVSVPVWRRSYGDSRAIAGGTFGEGNVETPGGDYPQCLVGDIRNPDKCFSVVPDKWITFLFHLRPGFSNYHPGFVGAIATDHVMLPNASQPEADITLVDASAFPDPATWGPYPLQVRANLDNGVRSEVMRVLSKSGNTLRVMRNWWRSSGPDYTLPAGSEVSYGPVNKAPDNHPASWLQDAHLCPHHDSDFTVYAAYEGEKNYRTVFAATGLPFVYGRGGHGLYGNGEQQLPGYCFFKPESYMNAYLGSGSQGPPLYFDALYTQIILSRNFIPCPQA